MCPESEVQRRLNDERRESKGKPDDSIQKPESSGCGLDLSENAKRQEQHIFEETVKDRTKFSYSKR